jgi:L-amino acid N-acyltransferase YncA
VGPRTPPTCKKGERLNLKALGRSLVGCLAMNIAIAQMQPDDWEDVRLIFREGIATGQATFETDIPGWEAWDKSHLPQCRLVARSDGEVVGWAALSPVSGRCVYAGVAEVSVYVRTSARGRGVGKALLRALIEESERTGIWMLQGGVFPENMASIALQRSCGFREVGSRERLGQMNGVWRDVLLMERRSRIVGM